MAQGIKKMEIAESDGILNLKDREKGNVPFKVSKIGEEMTTGEVSAPDEITRFAPTDVNRRMENFAEKLENAVIRVSAKEPQQSNSQAAAPNPKDQARDLIKVKFEKFVQLVATRNFVNVLEKNKDEDIILSSNLLTDLASTVEEKGEKKTPIIFLVGLAIGIALTYLLLNR